MLRLTAQHADAWNTAWFGALDEVARQRIADLDAACDEVGRPRHAIRRTIGIRLHEPGQRGDDTKGTDADAEGLADLFDELDAAGFDDTIIWSLAKSHAAIERIGEARRLHLARDRTTAG
jgi:alkanesulfonate monooxygenase SsuD/methylene tetrahydromethanopterin reductase-like flavin-dependent oxidoreductase (luciferase family)